MATELAVPAEAVPAVLERLWRAGGRAHLGARPFRARMLDRMRQRLRSIVDADDAAPAASDLLVEDLFDPRSGAVRLRAWEVPHATAFPRAAALFGLHRPPWSGGGTPLARRLASDTAVLLRGTVYYAAYARCLGYPEARYLADATLFLDEAVPALHELTAARPSLVAFKLVAAICDNVRGVILTAIAASCATGCDRSTEMLFELMVTHSTHHRALLLDETDWAPTVYEYGVLVGTVRQTLIRATHGWWPAMALAVSNGGRSLLRERHSDDFAENLLAVEIGLTHLTDADDMAVACVGIASGGIELTAVAVARLRAGSRAASGHLMRLSRYREGGGPVTLRPELSGAPVVLFDDNIMTGATLQEASDRLSHSAFVRGAVVVRYPTNNLESRLRAQGCPNPEALLTTVRGLTSAMPAAPTANGPRHKAEDRIISLLRREMVNL